MPGKEYNPAMHTAEHILNSVMDKMYHCGRSFNSHIEDKKSKCDYRIRKGLSDKEVTAVERTVNEIIKLKLLIFKVIHNLAQVNVLSFNANHCTV